MWTALTTRQSSTISSTPDLKLARQRLGAQNGLREKVHQASDWTCRTGTWHARRLIIYPLRLAKSVRKHIKGHLETWHVGFDSICACGKKISAGVPLAISGKKISAGVPLAITKEMAVGGLTKKVMRFVGGQDVLVSHARGHKASAIRSPSSSRSSALS